MDIGGRIPPLLEALALLFRRIQPWSDFFVMRPSRLSAATAAGWLGGRRPERFFAEGQRADRASRHGGAGGSQQTLAHRFIEGHPEMHIKAAADKRQPQRLLMVAGDFDAIAAADAFAGLEAHQRMLDVAPEPHPLAGAEPVQIHVVVDRQ